MTQTTERHELIAWLGNDHSLTDQQITELVTIANEINDRYPAPDDQPERDAALQTALWLLDGDMEPGPVVDKLADDLLKARQAQSAALAGLQQAAHTLVATGQWSENGFAADAGIDRMTVRKWLGKRD
jgi:hypothetical protein